MGVADGVGVTLVYTDREEPDGVVHRRIISARVSSRHERTAYQQAINQA